MLYVKKGGSWRQSNGFRKWKEEDWPPDAVSYNIIIHDLLLAKEVDEVMPLLKEMREKNHQPNDGVASI